MTNQSDEGKPTESAQQGSMRRAIEIVESEPELDGEMPKEVAAQLKMLSLSEMIRIAVRASKKSIIKRLQASPSTPVAAPQGRIDLSERQKLMGTVELNLRRRIHNIERHNQYFFRCESAWCNPSDEKFMDPAKEPSGDPFSVGQEETKK